jgi:hypothetical protein
MTEYIELYLEKTSKEKDNSFRGVLYKRRDPISLQQPDEISEIGRNSEAFFLIADLSLEGIAEKLSRELNLPKFTQIKEGIYSFNFQEKDRMQIVGSFARINY